MGIITTLQETDCKDCGTTFSYYPGNSTIKPARCKICERNRIIEKRKELSKKRIEQNKNLLRQSSFSRNSYNNRKETHKYTTKSESAKKRLKTPRERFYSSTAWKWFSRYVLMYYSIDGEIVKCCTSGRYLKVNTAKCHVGHYIKVFDGNSTNYSVAFDFTNVGPQSQQDNTFMGGRQDIMVKWLENKHGKEAVEQLYLKKNEIFKLDQGTLKQIADTYRNKFHQLLKERGWKDPWKK